MNSIKNKSFNLEAFVRNEQPLTRRRGFEFMTLFIVQIKWKT